MENDQNIATLGTDLEGIVSVSFSPDGTTLAAGFYEGIQLWDVTTHADTATFSSESEALVPLTFISFSPDGGLIAATLDANVALWDVETGTQINILLGHTEAVRSVSFSLDGSLIASGALDGTVRLWDPLFRQEALIASQEALIASTEFPLTEATLDGSIVTLTLSGRGYSFYAEDDLTVSGIDGVTVEEYIGVERVSDTEVRVKLAFDGDFDTDATLTFTVGADAIADSNQGFTAEIPVTAIQKSNATVSISPLLVVSPDVGEELTFSINIVGGENVTGYQATVLFNSAVLRDTWVVDKGDYLPADTFFDIPEAFQTISQEGFRVDEIWEGSVTIAASTLAGAANGDGTLATLTFKVIDFKPSTLALSQVYLVDTDGKRWETTIQNGTVTIPPEPEEETVGDINRDGVVDILDLTIVGVRLGDRGPNSADINGDGLVDIVDLVLVAGAFGGEAAAPSAQVQVLELLTAAGVRQWLTQAQQLVLTDPAYLRGIAVLEQLHAVLIPQETILLPNYPNPFNPETWIPYRLAEDAFVTLTIYDGNGQVVRTLDVGHQIVASYESRSKAIHWDGRNEFGVQVASGLYFYHLSAENYSATRKILILK